MAKYQVMVKPGSSQEKVVVSDDGLTVYLRAKAHDGEANKALVRVLAEYFKVGKTSVVILRGQRGRKKVVEII